LYYHGKTAPEEEEEEEDMNIETTRYPCFGDIKSRNSVNIDFLHFIEEFP
jgi:hypothetical protein